MGSSLAKSIHLIWGYPHDYGSHHVSMISPENGDGFRTWQSRICRVHGSCWSQAKAKSWHCCGTTAQEMGVVFGGLCIYIYMCVYIYIYTSSTAQGGGGSFSIGNLQKNWLLWITDGRANPLIDRKVVGVVFVGVVAMVAVVTSPTTAGCTMVYCRRSRSCSVVEL